MTKPQWEEEFDRDYTTTEMGNFYNEERVWTKPKGVPYHVKDFIRSLVEKTRKEANLELAREAFSNGDMTLHDGIMNAIGEDITFQDGFKAGYSQGVKDAKN